jgi:type IV secretory pathway VirB4 component
MQFTEHRSRAQGLADLLLYDSLIDDGVMLLQDGALMAAWTFRGPDMASATNGEMVALSARLNSVLKLGTGWMIQCDAIRSRAPEYPGPGRFPRSDHHADRRGTPPAIFGGGRPLRERVLPEPDISAARANRGAGEGLDV